MRRILLLLTLAATFASAQTPPNGWQKPPQGPPPFEGAAVEWRPSVNEAGLSGNEATFTYELSPDDEGAVDLENLRLVRYSAVTGLSVGDAEKPVALRTLGTAPRRYAARLPAGWPALGRNDRVGLLLRVRRRDPISSEVRTVWDGFAATGDLSPAKRSLALDFAPSIGPAQELLNGRETAVGRLGLRLLAEDVLPERGGVEFDLDLTGTLSTHRLDPAGMGVAEFRASRGRFRAAVGARTNQAGRSSAGYVGVGADFELPRFAPSVLGAAPILSFDVRGESRWRRDEDDSPHHLAPSLAYGILRFQTGPLWIAPQSPTQGTFERDFSLFVDARLYGFIGEEGRSGYSARDVEGYLSLDLVAPKSLFNLGPFLLDAYLQIGALEGQNFRRSTVFGIGLTSKL